jgi:hypothetical protein
MEVHLGQRMGKVFNREPSSALQSRSNEGTEYFDHGQPGAADAATKPKPQSF